MDDTTNTETSFGADTVIEEGHSDEPEDVKEQHEQEYESDEGSESSRYDSEHERLSDEEFEMNLDEATFESDEFWRSGMDARIEVCPSSLLDCAATDLGSRLVINDRTSELFPISGKRESETRRRTD